MCDCSQINIWGDVHIESSCLRSDWLNSFGSLVLNPNIRIYSYQDRGSMTEAVTQ